MFQCAPGAPPAPARLDFALPDSLLRARQALLFALRPALAGQGRELSESEAQFLRVLVQAGAPLSLAEACRRAGMDRDYGGKVARRLVTKNYAAWAAGGRSNLRLIAARDLGRRQLAHAVRALARDSTAADWDALAARPPEARFSEPMRRRLFALLTKLRRACAREPVLDGANRPDPAGDDFPYGLALQLRLARKALVARFKTPLAKYDFTEAQWRVLRILAWQPGVGWTLTALCGRGAFHFCAPNVSEALFYLSQRGLVQRHGQGTRPKAWRRKKRGGAPQKNWKAEISREGLLVVDRVERREAQDCADLFERLDGDEMALLERLLDRLTAALLWRDDVAPEAQECHPFGAEYEHFTALNRERARAYNRERRIWRQNGIAIPPPKRKRTPWHA